MESQINNRILPPSKTSSARSGLHLVELLAERAPWKLQTSQAIATALSYSPQPDGKSPLLETTLTFVIDRREAELVLNMKLHPY